MFYNGSENSLFQRKSISLLVLILLANNIHSDDILISIDKHKSKFENVALEIWDYAELGYLEKNSSSLLASSLEDEGFTIKKDLAGIPSAFIAEFNNGGPVIGILGEFDALPGLAQTTSPFKEVANNSNGAGHACGHHLFGAASAWAAVAIKEWIVKNNIQAINWIFKGNSQKCKISNIYLKKGEITVISGISGVGKTTFLDTFMGLLIPIVEAY